MESQSPQRLRSIEPGLACIKTHHFWQPHELGRTRGNGRMTY
jgi:hypothetical protein